jgi:sigma54-dependent transcription regulator
LSEKTGVPAVVFLFKKSITFNMNNERKLGIWMDHASAHIMPFTLDTIETNVITSKFTHQEKEQTLSHGESHMHNKEQHLQADYYKKIGDIIKGYGEVLLFGPTDAKVEFLNVLRENHQFDNIKIEVHQTDKMTENQEHDLVKAHFSRKF